MNMSERSSSRSVMRSIAASRCMGCSDSSTACRLQPLMVIAVWLKADEGGP